MDDKEFLSWIHNRIVYVYGENPLVDFVQRLRKIVENYDNEKIDNWAPMKDSESGEIIAYYNPKYITSKLYQG
jgi:hypothetical protein